MRNHLVIAALVAAACSGRPSTHGNGASDVHPGTAPAALKMRHQISFQHGDDVQVFEGYMLLSGDKLLVRAFAGPGVDLFTVVRNGAAHLETLHIGALADRIDMARVGADIGRIYLGGCEPPEGGGEAACDFQGEPLQERYDASGRLVARRFPSAHGVGLDVTYSDFAPCAGEDTAQNIVLKWRESRNAMTIRLVSCEPLDRVPSGAFDTDRR